MVLTGTHIHVLINIRKNIMFILFKNGKNATYCIGMLIMKSLISRVMRKQTFCICKKTKGQISFTVTAKLISEFAFATRIVQFLYFLNPKFSASSPLLCLYSWVCVGPVRKPHCWFSHATEGSYTFGLSMIGDTVKSLW